jgi:hypothetical protein
MPRKTLGRRSRKSKRSRKSMKNRRSMKRKNMRGGVFPNNAECNLLIQWLKNNKKSYGGENISNENVDDLYDTAKNYFTLTRDTFGGAGMEFGRLNNKCKHPKKSLLDEFNDT